MIRVIGRAERYYNRLLPCDLIPQDPSDEPAAELLARIRASRAAFPGKKASA
jgi:hypothetical protein